MRTIPKDKVILRFDPEGKANHEVEGGEVFQVEVDDCCSGQITDTSVKRPSIDISIMDYAVGPINVRGARPGDTLYVGVLATGPASQDVMVTSVGLEVLGDRITEPDTRVIPVHDGFAHFSKDIKLPLAPMIDVMSVAPKEKEIHCAVPEDHGTNMDTKLVAISSRVYFPVGMQGAGLVMDDIRACMGDGGLSSTGIEVMDRTCLKTMIYRDRPIERPVIEATNGLYFLASRPMLEESIRIVVDDTIQFLMKKLRLSFLDVYRLLSATCDAQICRVMDDSVTVRIHHPKFHTGIQTL